MLSLELDELNVFGSIIWCKASKIAYYIMGKFPINSAPWTGQAATKLTTGRLCIFGAMNVCFQNNWLADKWVFGPCETFFRIGSQNNMIAPL